MKTAEYLVVYEKGEHNWSGFFPSVLGCGSVGDSAEELRANMREAIEFHLTETAKAGEPIPEPTTTTVDFEEFDPGHETKQYVVEWLSVAVPQSTTVAA